jgi:amino acid transporter
MLAGMAAVFALIFVPAIAAILCMLGEVHGHLSLATVAATTTFLALIIGLLTGLFRLARQWEAEGDRPHV